MVSIFFPYKFPSLNDYIAKERIHRQVAAKMKKEWTDLVTIEVKKRRLKPFNSSVAITFEWYEENAKRDPDNIIFAKKFLLDGIVKSGLLPNDSQKWILAFDESWYINPKKPGVKVTINEYE